MNCENVINCPVQVNASQGFFFLSNSLYCADIALSSPPTCTTKTSLCLESKFTSRLPGFSGNNSKVFRFFFSKNLSRSTADLCPVNTKRTRVSRLKLRKSSRLYRRHLFSYSFGSQTFLFAEPLCS